MTRATFFQHFDLLADQPDAVARMRELVLELAVRGLCISLPPLAEQKRIVARVEALLRQCDALEAQLRQTRTLGAHLLESTLHHLLAA